MEIIPIKAEKIDGFKTIEDIAKSVKLSTIARLHFSILSEISLFLSDQRTKLSQV